MSTERARPRRGLILAGGGLKVAFQAGVLQVLLDEAGLDFEVADGASGGVLNLAMWCQGLTGAQIADNWRRFRPLRGLGLNWRSYPKLYWLDSVFTLDRFRENILRADWGLDWEKIRGTPRQVTFNTYNFSRHELAVTPAGRMNEDLLVAAISLPLWFPPVRIAGEEHIDAVYVTDANLDAALASGADELWIVWTVSDTRPWRSGLVRLYFQVIESAANGPFKLALDRIRRNNARVRDGLPSELGRTIDVKLLKAEVPVDYLFNVTNRPFRRAVELGVDAGRRFCAEQGVLPRRGAEG